MRQLRPRTARAVRYAEAVAEGLVSADPAQRAAARSFVDRTMDAFELALARGEPARCPITGAMVQPAQHDAHVREFENVQRIRARKAAMGRK